MSIYQVRVTIMMEMKDKATATARGPSDVGVPMRLVLDNVVAKICFLGEQDSIAKAKCTCVFIHLTV
jgi:hypothetical protein